MPTIDNDVRNGKKALSKKVFRTNLRNLAHPQHTGDWSRNPDMARTQQSHYVIELAGAGIRYGLIVAE
jgi:hypothetical protein